MSVLSPFDRACNTTLFCYAPHGLFPPISDLLECDDACINLLSPNVRSALQVAFFYLSRINEVLCLTVGDIISTDRVVCKGSKGGSAYILFLPGLCSQVSSLSSFNSATRLFSVTYMQCYRACVRAGLQLHDKSKKNVSRTHLYRYIFSRKVHSLFSPAVLSDLLHHKSESSQSYYLLKKE